MNVLDALRNWIDYPLRQLVRWRRGGLALRNEPKDGLYDHLPEEARRQAYDMADRLCRQYHLEELFQHTTADNYRENLYYLALIERALDEAQLTLPLEIAAADIGPSHWFYAPALWAALAWRRSEAARRVQLNAYEPDAYRVYADFYSRHDHALAHSAGLPGAHFVPRPFTSQPAGFDVITMLFPFIFLADHLRWGLPLAKFDPLGLLGAAWESLKPGGALIIANQGEAEHAAQRNLLTQAGASPAAAFRYESPLYTYDLPRYLLVAIQPACSD
jgi:hypothetical protein